MKSAKDSQPTAQARLWRETGLTRPTASSSKRRNPWRARSQDQLAEGGEASALRQASRRADEASAAARAPEFTGVRGEIRPSDGRRIQLVDAPSIDVSGTQYRVDRRHPTSAMIAMRDAARGRLETPEAARRAFDHLVEAVRDTRDPMTPWRSWALFEGIRDHLDQRTERVNRSTQWAEVLDLIPVEDRVIRIDRGLRALAKSFRAGKVPGVEAEDLIDLQGRTQATAFNFDMDHNILHLPGANYVLNTKTGDVKAFDHGEWAKMRHTVGQPGPLQDYKVLGSDQLFGSFQEADDGTDPGSFARALESAVSQSPSTWQAPMWRDFVWALERPQTAKNVFITTARGHFPRTIQNGMQQVLQAGGWVKHVPNEDHIFPVTADGMAQSEDYSQEKVRFIRLSLDHVQAQPLGPAAAAVRTTDGRGHALLHTMVFSDDDLRTANLVLDALQQDKAAGRWPNVKVVVRFTGQNHPDERAWARVVGGSNGPRDATTEELGEHEALRARSDRAREKMKRMLQGPG